MDINAIYALITNIITEPGLFVLSYCCAALYLLRFLMFSVVLNPRVTAFIHCLWFVNIGTFYLMKWLGWLPVVGQGAVAWFRLAYAGLLLSFMIANVWIIVRRSGQARHRTNTEVATNEAAEGTAAQKSNEGGERP